jgi:hypothetical protein
MTIPRQRQYGRRAPKRARAIQLSRSLTGVIPAHPAAVDQLARLNGGWQMLGNDQYGDCVAVTWANVRRLVTAALATEKYPTMDEVIAFYKTQNPDFPSQDDGMEIQTALEYLVKHGGPDGVKAVGFAAVNVANAEEVKAAIAIFGSVWTGITVLNVNQTEFGNGKPWDYVRSSPVDGGHSVITGGYGPAGPGPLGGDERFITWAEETSFTDSYWRHEVEEAWVVIWPEHLTNPAFLAGVDLTAFAADYTAITGKPFPTVVPPVPTPTPVPTPPPSPTPTPDPRLVQALALMQAWAADNKVASLKGRHL